MKKIQWGIIGCGDVTEVKSGPAFNKVDHSSLVAVMRRDANKAAGYALRHGVPKWYADAQQLIEDAEVNAIYVATPPQSHEDYTLRALQAGKAVYVEKPMAASAAAAVRMQQAAAYSGVKLCVAHYRKAQPRFMKVKALLQEGAIGEVRLVNLLLVQPPQPAQVADINAFWRLDPSISGGGLFHDLSPHQLDLMQYFFGSVQTASGLALNQAGLYTADDLVTGTIRFSNGVVFNGSWCFSGAEHEQRDIVEIIGSKGSIRFSTFSTNQVILSKKGEEQVIEFDDLPHVQQPMIAAVVNYFLEGGPNPSSAESAVATMQLIEAFTAKS